MPLADDDGWLAADGYGVASSAPQCNGDDSGITGIVYNSTNEYVPVLLPQAFKYW